MKWMCWLLIAGSMAAQTLDRTKPPSTPPIPDYKLPPTFEMTLPNGLAVVLVEDQRFPMVTARLGFQAGSKYDPKELSGLSEMTASLLKEGTKLRDSRRIAEEFASIGGTISTAAGADNMLISANSLAEHTAKLLELVADVAMNADFPQNEVDLRKQNRKQELLAQRSDPSTLADEKFQQVVFGDHPYSRMLPTPESIDRLDRKALLEFRQAMLAPNNAVLILIGALPPRDKTIELITQRFGRWGKAELPSPPPDKFPSPGRKLVLVDRPGSVQADIRVGQVSVSRKSPDYFPLYVGHMLLGGGASSRLFKIIREEKGYAYDAHTEQTNRRGTGMFEAVTQVRNEVVGPALTDLLAELSRLGTERVPASELTNVKSYISGVFVLGLETQQGLANTLATAKLNDLPKDWLETYVTRVRSVEPEQIMSVAKKYITPEDAAIVIVGDGQQIAKPLEKFGKVTVEKAQ